MSEQFPSGDGEGRDERADGGVIDERLVAASDATGGDAAATDAAVPGTPTETDATGTTDTTDAGAGTTDAGADTTAAEPANVTDTTAGVSEADATGATGAVDTTGQTDTPETAETEPPDESGDGARVCWLDDEDAEAVICALSSETARSIVTALHDRGHTASELAEVVDTSVQNVRHHLDNLRDAGLVEVAGTRYSVKGREMTVYGATDDRVLVAVGSEDDEDSFFDSLRGLLGSVAALVFGSALVQWALGTPEAVTRVPDSAGGTASVVGTTPPLPPGLVFLAGGLLVLSAVAVFAKLR